VKLINIKFI